MAEITLYDQYFSKSEKDKPYPAAKEYLADWMYLLDALIQTAGELKEQKKLRETRSDIQKMKHHIENRAEKSPEENRLLRLIKSFGLTDFEIFCLTTALAVGFNRNYEEIFARLQGSPNEKMPTKGLAAGLYQSTDELSECELAEFLSDEGVLGRYCLNIKHSAGTFRDVLVPERNIEMYLFYENNRFIPDIKEAVFCPFEQKKAELTVHEDIVEKIRKITDTYKRSFDPSGRILIQLQGKEGSGRRFLIKKAIAEWEGCKEKNIIFYDLSCLSNLSRREWEEKLCKLYLCMVLSEAVVCITLNKIPEDQDQKNTLKNIMEFLLSCNQMPAELPVVFFITQEEGESLLNRCKNVIRFHVPILTFEEKAVLWTEFGRGFPMGEELDIRAEAGKYVLTPEGIRNVLHTAMLYALSGGRQKIGRQDLYTAVKQRQQASLGSYASLIRAVFTWEDLVLESRQKNMLHLLCNQIRYREIVGKEWGFYEKMPYGRGVSALFYGSPGTGKTMAAQVVANELGLDLYRIDLSQIISKYIGETEKNISELFEKAQNINAVLFFDEADGLFAKRSEIKDSNDRSANSMTAHLLQKMEDYEGITILATNLMQNMDDAFKRRMKYIVQFMFPGKEMRLELFYNMFPSKAICQEKLDFEYFAEHFELSGSSIKEVLLNAAYLAAGEGTGIGNRHIAEAVRLNYMKYGKMLTDRDFGYIMS